jgi:hypothetical protein
VKEEEETEKKGRWKGKGLPLRITPTPSCASMIRALVQYYKAAAKLLHTVYMANSDTSINHCNTLIGLSTSLLGHFWPILSPSQRKGS